MTRTTRMLLMLIGLTSAAGVLAEGDAAAGKLKTEACAGCHGADGNSTDTSNPRLAGQHQRYLIGAIRAYQQGGRTSFPQHKSLVASLDRQDIADIAAYFAAQACK